MIKIKISFHVIGNMFDFPKDVILNCKKPHIEFRKDYVDIFDDYLTNTNGYRGFLRREIKSFEVY